MDMIEQEREHNIRSSASREKVDLGVSTRNKSAPFYICVTWKRKNRNHAGKSFAMELGDGEIKELLKQPFGEIYLTK